MLWFHNRGSQPKSNITRTAEQDESSGHSLPDVRRAPKDLEPSDAGWTSQKVLAKEGVRGEIHEIMFSYDQY